jgi:hypothetical protein
MNVFLGVERLKIRRKRGSEARGEQNETFSVASRSESPAREHVTL